LKYLADKWGLNDLGKRTAAANSIAVAIREANARNDTTGFIRVPYSDLISPRPDLEQADDTGHHQALQAFSKYLSITGDKTASESLEVGSAASGALVAMKHEIGSKLLAIGTELTKEFNDARQKQADDSRNVITRLLASQNAQGKAAG
jgi:hypothetical protein